MLREKAVEIEYGGEKMRVVVRELTWAEYNQALAAALTVENVGGVSRSRFDIARFRLEVMKRAVKEAPFPLTDEGVGGLPASLAEKIWRVVEELNPLVAGTM